MSENKTYNGWSNYETWNVALWLDNEEGSYNYWNDRAQEIFDESVPKWDWQTKADAAVQDLAEELKAQHEENMPTVNGVYADLLNAALSEVGWREIAEHYMGEVEKIEEAS